MHLLPTFFLLCTLVFALVGAKSIASLLESDSRFTALREGLQASPELLDMLRDEKRMFTVFAPTNGAIMRSQIENPSISEALQGPCGPQILTYMIAEHIIPRRKLFSKKMPIGRVNISNLAGERVIVINNGGGDIRVESIDNGKAISAHIVEPYDVKASNGVIHAIDRVLVSPTLGRNEIPSNCFVSKDKQKFH